MEREALAAGSVAADARRILSVAQAFRHDSLTRQPQRENGQLPIAEYAAIGDGRTVALVGTDGAVDWLCLPDLDSPSVFGRLLDPERGGSFELSPTEPYEASRRYDGETNVLETTFETASGAVRVTDALTLPRPGLAPSRELVRRVRGLSGAVPLRWRVQARYGYGLGEARLGRRSGRFVVTAGENAISVSAWDAGEPRIDDDAIGADFQLEAGAQATLVLGFDRQEPLVLPGRAEAEERLDATRRFWERWVGERTYHGPWRDEVFRSALVLKLLMHSPTGAIAAAPTTSLPEVLGGDANWDYRYCWIRDSAFTLDTMIELGCDEEAHAFLWWIMHASQLTHPELQVLYGLKGETKVEERELPLAGYGGAKPVRIGNAASEQLQLDVYGDLFETAWLYVGGGHDLDSDLSGRLAESADHVCDIWRKRDAGIWEVRGETQQYTHSKILCWVALDRACKLADEGYLSADKARRWRREADKITEFVQERCWSDEKRSYVRQIGSDELDAGILLAPPTGFGNGDGRMRATVDAVRRELTDGPLVYRYEGEYGAFLACSFWLVSALATTGRTDEACELMEELLPLANDVGLYSEEMDPNTHEFLGNFPQGLTHLALIGAALAVERETA